MSEKRRMTPAISYCFEEDRTYLRINLPHEQEEFVHLGSALAHAMMENPALKALLGAAVQTCISIEQDVAESFNTILKNAPHGKAN